MARFDRVALAAVCAVALGACNLIAGLGEFHEVPCEPCDAGWGDATDDADAGADANADADADADANADADADANADATADADAAPPADASDAEASSLSSPAEGGTSPDYRWARWRMPNGAETGLPNPASYADAGSGEIRDTITGLTWGNAQTGIKTFDGGVAACPPPWRLPTRIELVSILDTSQSSVLVNPVFSTMQSEAYWTSSVAIVNDAGFQWTVSFGDGTILANGSADAVICVHPGDGGAQ